MTRSKQLAIDGGPQSVTHSISPWPIASDGVKAALREAVDSDQWGLYHGHCTDRLQQTLQQHFDCTHSLLTCSGTMAVELALRGVGVKADSEVILAGYDFPGNFRAIEAIGAKPVLVDVCPGSWVIDPQQVAKAISDQTSAIIVSHLHGQLADLAAVRSVLPDRVAIVEDCCQVPGASIGGEVCGKIGDVSTFSFGGSKLLSAGRGGAVLSSDESIVERARLFGARGNDAFPLSQLQAAVLIPQIEDLSSMNRRRQSSVEMLVAAVSDQCGTLLMRPETQADSAWYKLPWLIQDGVDREVMISRLKAEGVPVDSGFHGFAKRTARRCRKVGQLENSIRAAGRSLLLHHPVLLEPEETRMQIVNGFEKVIRSLNE